MPNIIVALVLVPLGPCGQAYPNQDCNSCVRKRLCAEGQKATQSAAITLGQDQKT